MRARATDGQKTGAPKKKEKEESSEDKTPSTAFQNEPSGPPSGQVGAVIGTSVRVSG